MRSQFYEEIDDAEKAGLLRSPVTLGEDGDEEVGSSYQSTVGGPATHNNIEMDKVYAPSKTRSFRSWKAVFVAIGVIALATVVILGVTLRSKPSTDTEHRSASSSSPLVLDQKIFEVNSLIFGVDVTTSKPSKLYVEYWRQDGEGPRLRSETTSKGTDHKLHFFRLHGVRQYEYMLYNVTSKSVSEVDGGGGTFRTGPVPTVLQNLKLTRLEGRASFLSLTTNPLMEGISKTKPQTAYMFDEDGEIVWYITLDHPFDKFNGFGFDRANPDNLNIISQGTDRMQMWSPLGELLKETMFYCPLLHHEGSYDTMDKNFAFTLGSRSEAVDGLENDQLQDVVIRWDIENDKLEEVIFFMDHMDVLRDRTAASDVPVSLFWEHCPAHDEYNNGSPAPDNWSHVNSARRSLSGSDEVVCSLKALDKVVAFSPEMDKKIWTLGGYGTDFVFTNQEDRFYHPHDAQMLENGNILIMDNGNTRPRNMGGPYSRSLEVELDYEQGTAKKVWDFALEIDGKLCESPNGGGGQRLANGNTIVQLASCSGEGSPTGLVSHTIEVTPEREVVFHLSITVNDLPTYRILPQTTVGGEIVVE